MQWATRMSELAKSMPGYSSHKGFVAEDGERVTMIEFESAATQRAWSLNAEHVEDFRRGTRDHELETSMQYLLSVFLLLFASASLAEDQLVKVDTRPGVSVSFYYMKREGAIATVVLLPGGEGGIGMKDGAPASGNFLVRSRDYFSANGFNVAVVGQPTDRPDLDFAFRVSPEHVEDLRKVAAFLKQDSALPVWLIGTSRGTISATAAAIASDNAELAGMVLTSSVTNWKKRGAVPSQRLDAIRIPVLVLHHAKDACDVCRPHEVASIIAGLKNAPVKKLIMVSGGAGPSGDPCTALHWHGFIGMEKEAVDLISAWVKNPKT
jgi:heme-degrading monooxygenase HmoA/pimeloyl-ACP methyl ester carboxylesterase